MRKKRAGIGVAVGLCLAVVLAADPGSGARAQGSQLPLAGVVKVISSRGGGIQETAAGIVVGMKGSRTFVLVANHVIAGAEAVEVQFRYDDRTFPAEPTPDFHEELDLAVVVVQPDRDPTLPSNLPSFVISQVDELRVVDPVLTIGHPRDLNWHISQSRIAELSHRGDFRKMLLMRADIEQGNSGGPILDDRGSLIGMVTHVSHMGQHAVGVYVTEALKLLELWQIDTRLLVRQAILVVASNPADADVYLDGDPVGSTLGGSLKLRGVWPGVHDLRVVREGYEPWDQQIRTAEQGRTEVMALLKESAAPLPPPQLDARIAYVVLHTRPGLRGKSRRILLFDGGTVNFKKGSRWVKNVNSLELHAPSSVEIVLSEFPTSHPKYPGAVARWRGNGRSLIVDREELKAKKLLRRVSSLRWLIDGRLANDFVYQIKG